MVNRTCLEQEYNMSDETGILGTLAAAVIVYVVTVAITGSRLGPTALIIDLLCAYLGDSLVACG